MKRVSEDSVTGAIPQGSLSDVLNNNQASPAPMSLSARFGMFARKLGADLKEAFPVKHIPGIAICMAGVGSASVVASSTFVPLTTTLTLEQGLVGLFCSAVITGVGAVVGLKPHLVKLAPVPEKLPAPQQP